MLNEDAAVPSFPCWTSHSLFSLNTRPGLTIQRRHDTGDFPLLRPLETVHALKPFRGRGKSPSHDLLIPSNEIRRRVLGTPSNYHDEFPTPDQFAGREKRRRRAFSVWEDDDPPLPSDPATSGSDDQASLTKFDNMLPALQRNSWMSFPNSFTPPIPFSTVRNAISEEDLRYRTSPSPRPPKRETRHSRNLSEACRRGNLLAHFKAGDENIFVLPVSGTLDSVMAYSLSVRESVPSPGLRVRKYAQCQKVPDIITFHEEPVVNVVTMPYSDYNETARLLVATANSLTLARISSDGVLKWDDHLDVPNVRSSTLSPLCPEGFSVLSSDGLFSGTADEYRACRKSSEVYQSCFHDVQCLAPEAQFRQVEYGTHPRTVLLASRKELVQFDLRARRREHRVVVLDLERNPETQARDSEIGTFCLAPNSDGFRFLLATRASLAYFDIRRPEVPLLDWSLVLPSAPDKICAVPFNPDDMRSDIVLLGSSQWGQTDVYHAVHTGKHDALSPFHRAAEPEMYGLPKMELAWSDLPLPISSMNAFQDSIDGITVVHDSGDRLATVLQWSNRVGLTLNPLEATDSLDPDYGANESCPSKVRESSINLNNSIWSVVPVSRGRCYCDRFPVSRSVPGSYLLSRVRRMLLRDVKELRKRLCSAEDDDTDNDGSCRVPRPYMQDLVSSGKCVGDTTSVPSTPEEGPRAQLSLRDEPAHGDDPGDRETIIGEAALLRSEESDDSDDPERDSMDFINAIGSGCFFDELSRSVRSGFGHHPMPLGVSALKEAIADSPLTNSYETTWHAQCEKVHSASSRAVSTADTLPSWLCTTVYFTEEAEKGDSIRTSSIPETSQYGVLLARMQTEFFD